MEEGERQSRGAKRATERQKETWSQREMETHAHRRTKKHPVTTVFLNYFLVPHLCRHRKTNIAAENFPVLLIVNNSLFILSFLGFHNLNFIQTNE